MRKSVACLGLCFLLVQAANVYGQSEIFPPTFDEPMPAKTTTTPKPARKVVPRMSTADRLIQQRAIRQAEERRARIEARQWRGVSLLRPTRRSATGFYSWYNMEHVSWWGWGPNKKSLYNVQR